MVTVMTMLLSIEQVLAQDIGTIKYTFGLDTVSQAKYGLWNMFLSNLNGTQIDPIWFSGESGFINNATLIVTNACPDVTMNFEGDTVGFKSKCVDFQVYSPDFQYVKDIVNASGECLIDLPGASLEAKFEMKPKALENGKKIPQFEVNSIDLDLNFNASKFQIHTSQLERIVDAFKVIFLEQVGPLFKQGIKANFPEPFAQ